MIVTHLFQVLGFVAMEPPNALSAKSSATRSARSSKRCKPIDVNDVVRGQYEGYRAEHGVDPSSRTETFVALKVEIDNWRWAGVPFYLRSGKSMGQRRKVITLGFRKPTLQMFPAEAGMHATDRGTNSSSTSTIRVGSRRSSKPRSPGPRWTSVGRDDLPLRGLVPQEMHELEGYEQLILEAMRGDQALFTRSDGIERLWEVATPLLDNPPPVELLRAGFVGPDVDQDS